MGTTKTKKTPGSDLAEQLFACLGQVKNIPMAGTRQLPVLEGVSTHGFDGPQENALARLAEILAESERVFRYGNTIVLQTDRLDAGGKCLQVLRDGATIPPGAADWLANVFVCGGEAGQCPPFAWLVNVALRSETIWPVLPQIRVYANRPLFSEDYSLCGPGWHPDTGILVHGESVDPIMIPVPTAPGPDRIPPKLRKLLDGFCFRTLADRVNAVALLLTGLLVNHFIGPGKPIWLIDGNQPGTGKTLLVRTNGMVLDGVEPRVLHYTPDDEELQKRLCASLRSRAGSVLLIDNAKMVAGTAISSPVLESVSVAPEICLRILGASEMLIRPNDLVWAITMNGTQMSPDLVSRGVPVQLFYEGRPEERSFQASNPIDIAREHRGEILGELMGMVVRWNQAGRPEGKAAHRMSAWAKTIGGILEVAGLPEFLTNAQETAATFNSAADQLAALAEAVVADNGPFEIEENCDAKQAA